jgi:hypothetical protein
VGQILREAGALETAQGIVELQESAALGQAASELAVAGLGDVAEGAREIGAAETTVATGEALEEVANA